MFSQISIGKAKTVPPVFNCACIAPEQVSSPASRKASKSFSATAKPEIEMVV